MTGPNTSSERFATPHRDSQGERVLRVKGGLSEEQIDGLLARSDGVWGEDVVVKGSSDGTLVLYVTMRPARAR